MPLALFYSTIKEDYTQWLKHMAEKILLASAR